MSVILRAAIALASLGSVSSAAPMRVAVTGAGGQTGGHVFRKMLGRPDLFSPVGITRTPASRQALLDETGAAPDQVWVIEVSTLGKEEGFSEYGPAIVAALTGAAALVIATSAKVKPTGGTNSDTGRPNMGFPDGQPYLVDWLGQKHQIDAAAAAGVGRVVICSSMGGTNPENMLNKFGRADDGTRKTGGGILLWKRKAEKYLIDSGLKYTIVHPGGLLNEPGGRRPLVVGIDDKPMSGENRSIPREDVAEVLLQSLLHEDYLNRSFDVISQPDSGAEVATDFAALLAPLQGANCDYGLGTIPDEAAAKVEEEGYSWDEASMTWQSV